jgi:hypothetical protein
VKSIRLIELKLKLYIRFFLYSPVGGTIAIVSNKSLL